MDGERFKDILTRAFRRMHEYTCAEASLQGLLEYWGIPREQLSWATAGYMGAIQSGNTTCGLLIGSSIAIGLKIGMDSGTIPENSDKMRKKSISEVKRLYRAFLKEFGCTACKEMCGYDFSDAESTAAYLESKAWKETCDKGLKFIFEHLKLRTERGKL
ncbi:MAG: C-GCAxxG-C-C family (seleno)protein [Promethearchaeota archaeon]